MMYEISFEWPDGGCETIRREEWSDVQFELDDFNGKPVRIWVDGEMVQQGFVAADDATTPPQQ